jgi:hypothetical protein
MIAASLLIQQHFHSPARAVIGTVDDVPAATLLLPFFEVDLSSSNGVNTVLSVNNASSSAVLAHVVLWSELSVPVLDFNIYLTGYDVAQVSLRDVLNGHLPFSASAGQDPTDAISPKGIYSQDINFASCAGQLPTPTLPANFIEHLRLSLTGKPSPLLGGSCASRDLGDNIARGYLTVDTVSFCSLRFPGDPGYFIAGGLGDATNQNVLWGDFTSVNPAQNFAHGDTLVHVEANATDPETSLPGQYTFYGRYVNWTAADNREPLATNFAVRYLNGGTFDGGADLVVWRDSKIVQNAFTCGTLPSWFGLGQESLVIFDEHETPEVPTSIPVSPQPPSTQLLPFPAESQRTAIDGPTLPVTPIYGWVYLNLNTTVASSPNPPEDPAAAQAWVMVVMDAEGRFSVGFDAVRLDSATAASHDSPAN